MSKRALLPLLLLVACKSPASAPRANHDAGARPSAPTPATAAALDGGAGDAGVLGVVSVGDKKRFADYGAALVCGRKATLARKYADAIAAFDQALAFRPGDDRAVAEKGYAELLSGDLVRAQRHLRFASSTPDRDLASQVWFNLGLVDEAKMDADDALVDFWFANELRASAAAQAKIAGRAVCPVKTDPSKAAATHLTSWREVARTIRGTSSCGVVPVTDTAAKAALVTEDKPLTVPGKGDFFLVRQGKLADCGATTLFVVQVSGGDFWVYPEVGQGFLTFDVESEDVVKLEPLGSYVRAAQTSAPQFEHMVCEEPHDDERAGPLFECTGAPDEIPAGRAFPPAPAVYTDHVFDPDAHARVLRVEDAASGRFPRLGDGGGPTSLRPDGGVLHLDGYGCSRSFTPGRLPW